MNRLLEGNKNMTNNLAFGNINKARAYARRETIFTHRNHEVVKSKFFNMGYFDYMLCYTVILKK